MPELNSKGIEQVACNLCGADDTELLFNIPVRDDQKGIYGLDVWPIVRCRQCHLTYTNPRQDKEALTAYYAFNNEYDNQFIQEWFIGSAPFQRPTWQRFLRVLGRYVPNGRLLDVGCGIGSFLVEARQAGYSVMGQEISPLFVTYCRETQKLTIFDGEIEEIRDESPFDALTLFDVIEHHPDPKKLLQEMHRLLKPGGLVMISTHDIGNIFARWYGPRWRYLMPIGHLTYFTKPTLAAMLQATGFEVVQTGSAHTIDNGRFAMLRHTLVQFTRVIVLRSLVLGVYKPLTTAVPALSRWQFRWGQNTINHKLLLVRAGTQVIMNDDMVLLGRKK